MERKTPHKESETSIRWHKTTVNNVEIMGMNNVKLGVRATNKTTPLPPPPPPPPVDQHKNHATGPIITRSKSTTTKPNKHEDTRLGKRPLTISSSSTTSRAKPTSTRSMSEKGQSSNSKDDRRLGKRSITISSSSSSSMTNRAKPTPTPSIAEKGQSSNSKNDPRLGKRSITISSSSSSSTINRAKPTSTPSMAEKGSSSNSRDDSRLGKRSITISSSSSSTTSKAKPTSIPSMAEKGSSSSNSRDDSRLGKRSITISSPSSSTIRRAKPTSTTSSMAEKGSSSSNSRDESRFVCELCVESRRSKMFFSVKGCSHAYCDDCIAKYVTSKVEQNITSIGCPVSACRGKLDPEYCRKILPEHVFDRWGKALCETMIVGAQKFYCPFKDCSALLINDGKKAIRESECPHCHRLFCAQCRVPWHSEIDCARFQKLNKNEREREDIMLMKLAQNKKWQRCPNCKYYVEKKEGCMYMYCRCRTAFCYNCGNVADALNHRFHYCSKCKR